MSDCQYLHHQSFCYVVFGFKEICCIVQEEVEDVRDRISAGVLKRLTVVRILMILSVNDALLVGSSLHV